MAAAAERRTELGIVSDSVDLGGLESRMLCDDPLVVLTAPHDPLAHRATARYTDIVDRTFVGLSHASGFPLGARPTYRVRLPSLDAVCQAAAADTGIAIMPRYSVTDWITNRRLLAIDLDERWAHRHLVICFTADHELSTTARALPDHLTATGDHGRSWPST